MTTLRLAEYQKLALRTAPSAGNLHLNGIQAFLLHGSLGITTEVDELIRDFHDRPENNDQEAGDVLWYCNLIASCFGTDLDSIDIDGIEVIDTFDELYEAGAMIADQTKRNIFYGQDHEVTKDKTLSGIAKILCCLVELGFDLEECAAKNITKLQVRYPEKFDASKALNRDVAAEEKAIGQR